MQQRALTPDDTTDSQTNPPTDVLAELPPSAKLVAKVLESILSK